MAEFVTPGRGLSGVLTVTEIAGFIGVGLAGAAYVPQIWHLVRVHCSAGISRFAFCLWLSATLLVTTNAIATGATVFIVLGGVQIVATALILLFTTKYRSTYCAGHLPVDLGAETEQELIDDQLGGLGPGVRVDPVASLGRG
ncbi:MAG: PQ-loop repeat-containing protein [Actinomycetota bacterium]